MLNLSIRKELFWDMDPDRLDALKNKRMIIERVLSLGNLTEFVTLMHYYGQETITEEIKRIGYLDPLTLEFVTSYFGIKKEQLNCYIKKQSVPQHWD